MNRPLVPTSGHLKVKVKTATTIHTDTKISFATRDHEAKEESQDTKTTSGHLKIIDFPLVLSTSRNFMFFLIFEFLTARGREAHFEKIRKSVKQNVNGSVEKQYVLLEFLTAL
jgi:hypothetical protein